MTRHSYVTALMTALLCLPVFIYAQNSILVAYPSKDVAPALSLAPGDLIDLQVFETLELSGKLRISEDGFINLPATGRLAVAGMTPHEASVAVEKRLMQSELMLDPHVTILVLEYSTQGTTVLGEVNRPGTYLLLGRHTLNDALSAAGGITQREGSKIFVTHRSNPTQPVVVPVDSPNYSEAQQLTLLQPGDAIVVSRAESIFVIGDVGHPGEFPIVSGAKLNVLDGIALAQGANHTAKLGSVSIVRQSSTNVETIPLDLKKVEANREPDLILQPGDVIVVPRSGIKTFLDYAVPNATGAVAGAVAAALVYR